jgi:hypothetical protein
MPEQIAIPEAARRVKADFPEFPSNEIVQEILEFVRDTGEPWLWRGHTHTPIPEGSVPKYVWEFDVPEFGSKRQAIAPCPHCQPNAPKYKHGVIAYFPDEHVIRLMGADCFRATNPEAHEVAKRELERFQRSVRNQRYLQERLPLLPDLIHAAEAAFPQAEALDAVQANLVREVQGLMLQTLQQALRSGELRVRSKGKEATFSREGVAGTRDVEVLERFGAVDGVKLLMELRSPIQPKLRAVTEKLRELNSRYVDDPKLKEMHDGEKASLVRGFQQASRRLTDIYASIKDRQRFIAPANLATLARWSEQEAPEVVVFIERVGQNFRVGKTRVSSRTIEIPNAARRPLLSLPAMP